MKTAEEKLGNVKRFGARYGRKPKLKFSKIEAEQRKQHKCPYCSKLAVKRIAVGIWQCRKCSAKFTGKAYSVVKKITLKEEKEIDEGMPQDAEGDMETEATEET